MGSLTPYNAHFPDTPPLASTGPAESYDFSTFVGAILRRWRLFLTIVAAFVFLVGIATLLTPKTYTTTVRMMAGSATANTAQENTTELPILNALELQSGVQTAETLATLAQQESVAQEVASRLNLRVSPSALLNNVSVAPTVNTAILNLSVSWRDPQTSANVANAFATSFMWKERDFVRSQAIAAMGFLETEIPHAEARMRDSANELARFQAGNGFVDASAHTQDVVSKATALETKIEAATLDSREAKALLRNANAQLAALPPVINNAQQTSVNPVLTDLQTKLEQVSLQLSQARTQYTDRHPTVIALTKQREDLIAQIKREPAQIQSGNTLAPNPVYQSLQQQVSQYRQRIDGDAAQLALLQRERVMMSPTLHELPRQSMELATLQQRAKLAADVYNALEQKYNDAAVAKTTAISDLSIVQPATPGSAVVRPNLKINLAAALLVGLLLAATTVVIIDMYRRPVREGSESSLLGLPIIARIPIMTTSNRRMLPWLQSMTVEAFLHLCVSLKLKNKHPLHTLAVTSPSRGDGKSTIAFNLAKAMSTLEPRVLLIDADLRRPTLHDLTTASNKYGVTDVLEGTRTLSDSVQELTPNLDLLAAGHSVPNPVALMQSGSFDCLMRDAQNAYSMVIIDTPAMSCVTDGLLVTAKTDATIMVLASSSTNEREARHVVSQFAALGIDNLVGVVLNKDNKRVNDYSDYFVARIGGSLPGGTS